MAIVGMERKKENSSAAALDMPAICPAVIVDIDREVPGKTPDNIWQAPTHIACPRLMLSIRHVWMGLFAPAASPAASDFAFIQSPSHITTPPTTSAVPITYKLSRFLPITLVSK